MSVSTETLSLSIKARFEQVAEEQNKELPPLTDDMELIGSGIDSLCLAVVVARLADDFGYDPFSTEDVYLPVTLGDFIGCYADVAK